MRIRNLLIKFVKQGEKILNPNNKCLTLYIAYNKMMFIINPNTNILINQQNYKNGNIHKETSQNLINN